ncbi:MAG: hypothetical protein AAGE43_17805, partial [Pseudomonadota bacterium]
MMRADFSLNDRYEREQGVIFLSGIQALARLLFEQRRRDRRVGLNTGGFVSGYRGSPLGGLDPVIWQQREALEKERVHFQPGVNEELAATAVWGSQQVGLFPGASVDGVFGLWYGKAPGLDLAQKLVFVGLPPLVVASQNSNPARRVNGDEPLQRLNQHPLPFP